MVIEREMFIVEYDEKDSYIPSMIDCLEENADEIMSFFGLNSLDSKKKIIVYEDIETYKKHIEQFFDYYDYMLADTNDGNINILSLDACHKTKTYSNTTLEEYDRVILHEFVHICQQEAEIDHSIDDIAWFWEALATNLGNPDNFSRIEIKASNEEINDFNTCKNGYPIAFTIGNYMLENYSHEEILEYVKYPKKLFADSDKILDNARQWSKKKKEK